MSRFLFPARRFWRFALLSASALACDLSEPQKGTVAEVKDGETLTLADGTVVRLINAKAPVAPLVWRGDTPWPMVSEAKDALTQLASHAEVELRYGGTRTDRHRRGPRGPAFGASLLTVLLLPTLWSASGA